MAAASISMKARICGFMLRCDTLLPGTVSSRGETMRELAGKVAVITGAGSGFGLEFARIGARERMKLVLADVQQDALDAAVGEARDAGAGEIGVGIDLSYPGGAGRRR